MILLRRSLPPKGVDAPQWSLDELISEVVQSFLVLLSVEVLQTEHHQVDTRRGDEDRVHVVVDSLAPRVNEVDKACFTEDLPLLVLQEVLQLLKADCTTQVVQNLLNSRKILSRSTHSGWR